MFVDSYLTVLISYFNCLGDVHVSQDIEEDGALAVCVGEVFKVTGGYGWFKERRVKGNSSGDVAAA